jgi:hypothetical protein
MVLPYLKGFDYFLCSVFGEWFGFFLLILWVYFEFIFRSIQVLNKWYQSTFLGKKCGQFFFFYFCRFFFIL